MLRFRWKGLYVEIAPDPTVPSGNDQLFWWNRPQTCLGPDGQAVNPASLEMMTTPVRLRNGTPTNYALGVGVSNADGHPKLAHGGAVSGFVSLNSVWPDQSAAVVVFANADGSSAPGSITNQIAPLLLTESEDPQAGQALKQARQIFDGLLEGKIDRSLLTSDTDAYFTRQVLEDARLQPSKDTHQERCRRSTRHVNGGRWFHNGEYRTRLSSLATLSLASKGKQGLTAVRASDRRVTWALRRQVTLPPGDGVANAGDVAFWARADARRGYCLCRRRLDEAGRRYYLGLRKKGSSGGFGRRFLARLYSHQTSTDSITMIDAYRPITSQVGTRPAWASRGARVSSLW